MDAERGDRVLGDRYRLVTKLGEGGMSVVWRAYDSVLGRSVAVKLLSPRYAGDPLSRRRIRAEAQSAGQLSHPNVTQVHDYGESVSPEGGEPVPYVVMELLAGQTLAERLKTGPLPVAETLRIGAQVAAALAAAHAAGLVHRDVKPANVILTADGVKVVDFGLAAAAGDRGDSSGGEIWGTPAYLAPERLARDEVVPASDVYALGLLLYRALSGSPPWRADTISQMLLAHRYVEPLPLPPVQGVPANVAHLCWRCLAKDPTQRPTAAEVARVLSAYLPRPATEPESGPALAAVPDEGETTVSSVRGSRRRRRVLAAGLGSIVAAATVLFGLWSSTVDGDWRPGVDAAVANPPRIVTTSPSLVLPTSTPTGPGTTPTPGTVGATPTPTGGAGGVLAPDQVSGGNSGPGSSTSGSGGSGSGSSGSGSSGSGGSGGSGGGSGSTQTTRPAPPSTTKEAAPATAPAPVERTLSTVGGTLVVRCVGSTAQLLSATPLPTFGLTEVRSGPAPEVGLVFHAILTDVAVTVRCPGGVPQASITVS